MATTAAIYLRLSNDDGRLGESMSIETQRRECVEYCHKRGWVPVELAEPDDGFSGSDADLTRPGFEALLSAMAAGDVQAVVASKQDRIARNDPNWNEFRTTAEIAGTAVHTVEAGDLNLGTDTGYLNTGMRQVFSNFEARVIGSRTKAGLETARAQGRWTYSATFGYEKGGVINAEEAEWVRWAYNLILNEGGTPKAVYDRYEAEGVKTARGNRWTSVDRVIAMLKNPALAGFVTHKGEIVGPGSWEPIVTPRDRERMIETLRARSTGRKGHARRPARRYPLAGLALCGNPDCTRYLKPMIAHVPGKTRDGALREHYYYCDPRRGGCKTRIKGTMLDAQGTAVALAFLGETEAPSVESVEWDRSEQDSVLTEIESVRSLVSQGKMRAADGALILAGLHDRLDALNAAEKAHEAREADWREWHRAQQANLFDESDVFRLRGVLDNVRCLPDRRGFIYESKAGGSRTVTATEEGAWQIV